MTETYRLTVYRHCETALFISMAQPYSDNIATGHQQKPIVSSSSINPLDTNCIINSQLWIEYRQIFHHINENTSEWCQLIALQSFACAALIDAIRMCFIVNEETTKCSRYDMKDMFLHISMSGTIGIYGVTSSLGRILTTNLICIFIFGVVIDDLRNVYADRTTGNISKVARGVLK